MSEDFWALLSLEGRAFFNKSYEAIMKYHDFIPHPKTRAIGEAHWHTIAFNTAWLNSCLFDDLELPTIGDDTINLSDLSSN